MRLLRFAGLMFVLGSVASASAQTVRERLEKDPGFQIYPVIFGVTATTNSTFPAVRLVQVGKISKRPSKGVDAVKRDLPDAYIKAAKKKIQAEPPEPKMKDGKPVEVFTYFFYVPGHPSIVVVDLDKPLDKQPSSPIQVAKHGEPNAVSNAIGYAQHYSRSRDAVVRVYDDAGSIIETHEHARDFTES